MDDTQKASEFLNICDVPHYIDDNSIYVEIGELSLEISEAEVLYLANRFGEYSENHLTED